MCGWVCTAEDDEEDQRSAQVCRHTLQAPSVSGTLSILATRSDSPSIAGPRWLPALLTCAPLFEASFVKAPCPLAFSLASLYRGLLNYRCIHLEMSKTSLPAYLPAKCDDNTWRRFHSICLHSWLSQQEEALRVPSDILFWVSTVSTRFE